jgi:hypothetical protein
MSWYDSFFRKVGAAPERPLAPREYTIRMPGAVHLRLKELQKLVGADTPIEVIRRAIALYDALVVTTREEKAVVRILYPDGTQQDLNIR